MNSLNHITLCASHHKTLDRRTTRELTNSSEHRTFGSSNRQTTEHAWVHRIISPNQVEKTRKFSNQSGQQEEFTTKSNEIPIQIIELPLPSSQHVIDTAQAAIELN